MNEHREIRVEYRDGLWYVRDFEAPIAFRTQEEAIECASRLANVSQTDVLVFACDGSLRPHDSYGGIR